MTKKLKIWGLHSLLNGGGMGWEATNLQPVRDIMGRGFRRDSMTTYRKAREVERVTWANSTLKTWGIPG